MPSAASELTVAVQPGVLCGVANRILAKCIAREIQSETDAIPIFVAESLSQLVDCLTQARPQVILLDDELVTGFPLLEFLRQLTESAPVVLIASFDRQKEIANFVTEGNVEFVGRQGDFASLAASLMLRHLRLAKLASPQAAALWSPMSDDLAEIFRHDINNPLTGILGNAELVLSHGAAMPLADIQRLQTVVELAVRLRETIRQLSDAWERQSHAFGSAPAQRPL
jgi:signal transduction histidine kinase